MPRPSRLATLTANELTSWVSAIACSTPSEPSTAAPPTSTGSDAATSEPKMNSSRISTIGSEIISAERQVVGGAGGRGVRERDAAGQLHGRALDGEPVLDLAVRVSLVRVVRRRPG